MPRKDAILQGEIALGALEGRFWLPGSSVGIGGRAPAQGVHPSAVDALGVRNGQLPRRWSLLTTPFPKPRVPQSVGVRAGCPRPVWVGLLSGWDISNLYQPSRKAISAIFGRVTGPPAGGFDACGARALPGRTADVVQDPYPF